MTLGQNGPKLNSRLVYSSQLYGMYDKVMNSNKSCLTTQLERPECFFLWSLTKTIRWMGKWVGGLNISADARWTKWRCSEHFHYWKLEVIKKLMNRFWISYQTPCWTGCGSRHFINLDKFYHCKPNSKHSNLKRAGTNIIITTIEMSRRQYQEHDSSAV